MTTLLGLENQGMDYLMMVERVHEALELAGMNLKRENLLNLRYRVKESLLLA